MRTMLCAMLLMALGAAAAPPAEFLDIAARPQAVFSSGASGTILDAVSDGQYVVLLVRYGGTVELHRYTGRTREVRRLPGAHGPVSPIFAVRGEYCVLTQEQKSGTYSEVCWPRGDTGELRVTRITGDVVVFDHRLDRERSDRLVSIMRRELLFPERALRLPERTASRAIIFGHGASDAATAFHSYRINSQPLGGSRVVTTNDYRTIAFARSDLSTVALLSREGDKYELTLVAEAIRGALAQPDGRAPSASLLTLDVGEDVAAFGTKVASRGAAAYRVVYFRRADGKWRISAVKPGLLVQKPLAVEP